MKLPPQFDRPDYSRQLKANSLDEYRALISFVRHYWYLVIILVLGIVLLFYTARPIPPSTVVMATGESQSINDQLGQWYKDFFAEHGVDLVLVPSHGSIDNLGLLERGEVDAAFTQAGMAIPRSAHLYSLGSVQYEPLWFFFRGNVDLENAAMSFLSNKQVSIGLRHSGTQFMVRDMLKEFHVAVEDHPNLRELNTKESVELLLKGELDGLFVMANPDSVLVQQLLSSPDVHLWNFKSARAIAGRIHYADAVVFPTGGVSLSPLRPSEDINLVTTSSTITVQKNLHPAIQFLFMLATETHYKNKANYFQRPGGFPAFLDQTQKKSPVAVKYIENEGSVFKHDSPFWLASLFDRAWLLIAALFAISIPLMKLVPTYRKFHLTLMLYDHYGDMCILLRKIKGAENIEELSKCELEYEVLNDLIENTWAPAGTKEKFFFILNGLATLNKIIERRKGELQEPNVS
jgi:hypothetical protein